ncbi:MAG: hypothetical protein ABR584_08350 [Candidatus Baltobacteraceae bacterium]
MKILAIVLALVFLALAVMTYMGSSNMFPAIGLNGAHHTKHAIVYLILAVLCLVWMRMAGGAGTRRV